MAIYTYLDASTAHITEQDAKVLEQVGKYNKKITVATYREGYIVSVPASFCFHEYENSWREAGLSDSFIALMRHAQEDGVFLVRIDANGDIIDELEQHDW